MDKRVSLKGGMDKRVSLKGGMGWEEVRCDMGWIKGSLKRSFSFCCTTVINHFPF